MCFIREFVQCISVQRSAAVGAELQLRHSDVGEILNTVKMSFFSLLAHLNMSKFDQI